MLALSLWQPWASLIYDERKKIETRHWPLRHRGLLAIHAAMKVDKDACLDFGYDPLTIPRGAVLCAVYMYACVQFPNDLAPPDSYGDFYEGRYGFLMRMIDKFAKPIPAKGHQGIWNWDKPQENCGCDISVGWLCPTHAAEQEIAKANTI